MWHDNNDEKKEYIIEQRRRMEDQQLQTIGPIEEEVRIMEYRDLWINKDEQEVEKIAARSVNVYAVIPQREEFTEQKNISKKKMRK